MKRALITGITGQDGAYLAKFLLDKNYEVHGILRRASLANTGRIDHLYQDPHTEGVRLFLHHGDLTDSANLTQIIKRTRPDEIYNLAAQSHVKVSFESPEYTADVDALGTLRILEAIRLLGMQETTRFYQASTSELYGKAQQVPQDENTPFYPRSPYACSKLFAYWCTVNYREAYGMFACNGILFNHESPLRGETFVTRKITRAVARMALGLQDRLYLGNLDSLRDWGHAQDYVRAQWLILQCSQPGDFVVATGHQHSVQQFCDRAFDEIGITLRWQGEGVSKKGVLAAVRPDAIVEKYAPYQKMGRFAPGQVLVSVDPRYFRPTEVDTLLGNTAKARQAFGWQPEISFEEMVHEMVRHDLKCGVRELIGVEHGLDETF